MRVLDSWSPILGVIAIFLNLALGIWNLESIIWVSEWVLDI
jgi:hypothetical protein